MSKYKLAIVMRADLEMSTVKTCVQVEHASVYAFVACLARDNGEIASKWWYEGQFRVVLQVHSLSELEDLAYNACEKENLTVTHVTDFGPQAVPNTGTCIAIGPDLAEKLDKATKGLKFVQFVHETRGQHSFTC